jgi:hypothetical protein
MSESSGEETEPVNNNADMANVQAGALPYTICTGQWPRITITT